MINEAIRKSSLDTQYGLEVLDTTDPIKSAIQDDDGSRTILITTKEGVDLSSTATTTTNDVDRCALNNWINGKCTHDIVTGAYF